MSWSGVPHPVLTPTPAGTVLGAVLVSLSLTLGLRAEVSAVLIVLVAVFEIGREAILGGLAGLVELAVQHAPTAASTPRKGGGRAPRVDRRAGRAPGDPVA